MTDDDLDLDEQDGGEGSPIHPLEIAAFVLSATRRRWWLAALVFLSVAALGITAGVLLPKKYETLSRVLVGEGAFMVHVNPERKVPRVDEFRGLQERIFRQENLREIVREAELERLWTERRPTLLRFKDWLLRNGLDRQDERTRIRTLMATLGQRLVVETDHSTTITFKAMWSDPETAARIVEVTRDRFFQERLDGELDVLREALKIQEEQAKAAARDVDRFLKRVEKASWYEPPISEPTPSGADAKPRVVEVVSPVRTEVKLEPDPLLVGKLEKVRQRIRETKEPWQRRLTELKLQLTDLSATYAEKHPLIIHQKARIEEASVPPPELDALKAEESELLAKIEAFSKAPTDEGGAKRTVRVNAPEVAAPTKTGPVRIEQSAAISAEQAKLITAINKYNELSERVASTHLEIATAETAFKHRYLVTVDVEVPVAPLKPKLPLFIGLGSVVFGFLLSLAIGPLVELLRGRLLAPWQVKTLGLPLLGDVPMERSGGR